MTSTNTARKYRVRGYIREYAKAMTFPKPCS